MTLTSIAAMFSAMVVLAVMPDASAMAVAARSLSSGFKQGVIVIAGIVTGDLIFILIAVFGLAAIAEYMESLFVLIKYIGAAILIVMGVMLYRVKPEVTEFDGLVETSSKANFSCGLFITLADPKAILFYLGFLPAFIDLSHANILDIVIVLSTAIAALCCTKLIYAYLADKSRALFKNTKAIRSMNIVSSAVLLLTALFLVVKA